MFHIFWTIYKKVNHFYSVIHIKLHVFHCMYEHNCDIIGIAWQYSMYTGSSLNANHKIFEKLKNVFFWPQKLKKKNTSKNCVLMVVGSFFLSAAPTAQNSPELHFYFINSFIQPSRVESLCAVHFALLKAPLNKFQPV